jgi:hypothetical protein
MLMRRRNPDKGPKLIGYVAAEDSSVKYFLAMLKYSCNPADSRKSAAARRPLTGGGRTTTCGGCDTSSTEISRILRGVDAKSALNAKHTASRTKLASHAQRAKDVPVNFS